MDAKFTRIRPDDLDLRPSHEDVIRYINDLILDLKLLSLDQPPNRPVDMTRLEQWRKHRVELERCKERIRWH